MTVYDEPPPYDDGYDDDEDDDDFDDEEDGEPDLFDIEQAYYLVLCKNSIDWLKSRNRDFIRERGLIKLIDELIRRSVVPIMEEILVKGGPTRSHARAWDMLRFHRNEPEHQEQSMLRELYEDRGPDDDTENPIETYCVHTDIEIIRALAYAGLRHGGSCINHTANIIIQQVVHTYISAGKQTKELSAEITTETVGGLPACPRDVRHHPTPK